MGDKQNCHNCGRITEDGFCEEYEGYPTGDQKKEHCPFPDWIPREEDMEEWD